MIGKKELAKAVSWNDTIVEEGIHFEDVLHAYRVDAKGATYVAEQRAIRAWAVMEGKPVVPGQAYAIPVRIKAVLSSAWIDGLLAGLSISQSGYNTVCDVLQAGCRAIYVPFAAGGETEQTVRA